jgi:nucleoside-diphosphate-sugar epimerase
MKPREGLHVVLGGSGGVGSTVARLLAQESVVVRAVNRSGKIPFLPRRIEVAAAEAVVKETLRPVCGNATVIYHCIHPTRDFGLLVPITRHIVEIVAETGALLVMAGNMWPYGHVSGSLSEDLPLKPRGSNSRIYAQVNDIVMKAVSENRIKATIGRVAHCYGPYVRREWPGTDFAAALDAKPNPIVGDPDAPHTYTYIDDFARGLITLAAADEAIGKVWHVPSPSPISMREFLTIMYEELHQEVSLRRRNIALLWLRSLVNQEANRLWEMRYQFEHPFTVDSGRYEAAFGAHPVPHSEGIRRMLDWASRLEDQARKAASSER